MPFHRPILSTALAFAFLLAPVRAAAPFVLDIASHSATEIERAAGKALRTPIATIVEKPRPSPTGDAHDYISYGRYWWPDPTKPGGQPFIRRDGHPNREQMAFGDSDRLGRMGKSVETLALGWAVLKREDCAARAGEWLRAWFVTPATRMTPNFAYAQIRLGRGGNRGSASGLIDSRILVRVVDSLRLLEGSPALSSDDRKAVRQWFADYLQWLATSTQGLAEYAAPNNHGSWYLQQRVVLNRFLGHDDDARALAREDFKRIALQIKPDGRQPLELARADGLGYSLFNLEAQFGLARAAADLGVDLWRYETPDGASLAKALDYLRPYNADPKTWPGSQLKTLAPGFLDPLLAQAAALAARPPAAK
jgi:hypothetical protein